jgi:hypothetical protein
MLAVPEAPPGATLRCPMCKQMFTLPIAAVAPIPTANPVPPPAPPPPRPARAPAAAPRRMAPAANGRKRPAPAVEPAGGSWALRILGGMALAALMLAFLGGLSFLLWKNVFAERPAADRPAPSTGPVAQRPSAPVIEPPATKSEAPPPVAPKEELLPKKEPPPKKDPPKRDENDVDIADVQKPEKQAPPPPAVTEKPKPPPMNVTPPPPPEVTVTIPAAPAVPGVDAKKIAEAIAKGVKYLKAAQAPTGMWAGLNAQSGYAIGYTALAGLALLECDVPATDPAVRKAVNSIRFAAPNLNQVYDVAPAILLLERLGDKRDRALIQSLAARLLAAQSFDGGWNYSAEPLNPVVEPQMLEALRTQWPWSPAQPRPKGPLAAKDAPPKLKLPRIDLAKLPADVMNWNRWRANTGISGNGDNSNTQFAVLALWAARRHGIPSEGPILATYKRFLDTQQTDGGWPYTVGGSTAPMTCAGLLGLAVGHGALPPAALGPDDAKLESPAIDKALDYLSRHVGEPAEDLKTKPKLPSMYLLWSIERVAMLYDLKTIGGKDWYGWGAQALLANQNADGSWGGEQYQGYSFVSNTAFALLFLKRSNLVADLTENLRLQMVIRDPGAK